MSEQPTVQIQNLTKRYDDFVALDDLSIQLEKGRILGFIGPNGAGKTTTIKILVGLAKPTSGTANIAGVDCVNEPARIKQIVGYMPDVFGSYDNMRVHEYLDFFGAAFGIDKRKRKIRIDEMLELTGSAYMRDMYVQSLSQGMKQRVGIARTLLHDPQVLILDEPVNGLDPQARIEVRDLLLQLAGMGKTLIVTSHILPELSRICDVVAIITQGKLRAFGTLEQMMHQVRQRRMIEVQMVKPEQVELMAQLLRTNLDAGSNVTTSEHELLVRFSTAATDESLADLFAMAVQKQLAVSQFHEVPLDLEDAFLQVTRQAAGTGATK